MYDGFVQTTGDELWDRLSAAHARFDALSRSVDPAGKVANCDWSAREVVAHVLNVVHRYTERDITSPEGLSADPAALPGMNEAELRTLEGVAVPDLLEQIGSGMEVVAQKLPRDMDLYETFPFHGGITFDGAAGLGNLIGEFLLHGGDVARGAGKPWKLDARDAALVLNVGVQVVPAFVSPAAPGDLSVELRTPQSKRWLLSVTDGVGESRASLPTDRPDIRMYGRSQAFLLNLYGRVGIPGATMHGSTIIGGRRPWRVVRLPKTFLKP